MRGVWRIIGRNLLGWLLVLAGFIMLFTPGQGLLTMLAGLALADWPGRLRFFEWLRRWRHYRSAEAWVERKFGFPFPRRTADPPIQPASEESTAAGSE